ncbi:NAD-dependent protein deacetylase sirtuin-2, partial [Dissophora ornata]
MSSATAVRVSIKSRPLRPKPEPETRIHILKDGSISAIADLITAGNARNIIVMTGAGISTAAGIKDFRSPGTGLYDDLEKYNLPFPEAVFDLAFFKPTLTHYLLPLLAKKNLLRRSYTQNIDSLERLAGLDEDLLVEAHGSFATSKCVQCEMTSDPAWVKRHIMNSDIPYCKRCSGLVKPSITFFGENMPLRFSAMADADFEKCDLLIVLGTSLKVEPFNKLIGKVSPRCPRLLINREKAGQELYSGFDFDDKKNYTVQRDALFLGNCDDGVRELAALCGWEDELQAMYDTGHVQLKLAEEKEELESKAALRDEDEEDDLEKDDLDVEDESDRKTGMDLSESTASLDDITHRFGRSTLLSQSEDPYQCTVSQPYLGNGKKTEENTDPESEPSTTNSKKSLKQESAKDEASNTTPTVSTPGDDSKAATKFDAHDKEALLSQAVKDKSPAGRQPSNPSVSKSPESQAVTALADTTLITGHESVPAKISEPKTLDLQTSETVETMVVSGETSKSIQGEHNGKDVESGKAREKTEVTMAEAKAAGSSHDVMSTTSGSRSTLSKSRGSFTFSPTGTLTDARSSMMLMTSLASSTSTYTPLSIAAATPNSHQPFSTCVPVTAVCTNAVADTARTGGSGFYSFSSSMNMNSNNSNSIISFTSSGSSSSSSNSSGRGDGPGSLQQLVRRKRRKDFENASSNGGMLKGELRYLRGPGLLPPQYQTCGR